MNVGPTRFPLREPRLPRSDRGGEILRPVNSNLARPPFAPIPLSPLLPSSYALFHAQRHAGAPASPVESMEYITVSITTGGIPPKSEVQAKADRPLFPHCQLLSPHYPLPSLTLLESALPQNAPVTRLESALINSLDLKSFRIRTSKKSGGRRRFVNQTCNGACLSRATNGSRGIPPNC
jgi:hypothetical protein